MAGEYEVPHPSKVSVTEQEIDEWKQKQFVGTMRVICTNGVSQPENEYQFVGWIKERPE